MGQRATPINTPSGVVNLFKPVGSSSARYVYRLRRIFGLRKVGHAGSLDPFAEGVLLGCVGRGTKLVERLMALPKVYETQLRLGVTNATFDPEQPFEAVAGAVEASRKAIDDVVASLTGRIEQTPPVYSATRVGGRLSYQLARRGVAAPLRAKSVRVDRIEVLAYDWPLLTLRIRCGRGTYIRAIARDVGERLGTGAVCETLLRRRIGPFVDDSAVNLDEASDDDVRRALWSVDRATALIAGALASEGDDR
jgi:tRNA pseudouridine55 synthase